MKKTKFKQHKMKKKYIYLKFFILFIAGFLLYMVIHLWFNGSASLETMYLDEMRAAFTIQNIPGELSDQLIRCIDIIGTTDKPPKRPPTPEELDILYVWLDQVLEGELEMDQPINTTQPGLILDSRDVK